MVVRVTVESYRRDGVDILRGVGLTIASGESWVVLGPNGSGKTTLMRIVAGMEWPTRGSVEVLGERFGRVDLRELRKRIGFVSAAFGAQFPAGGDALSVVLSGFDASVGLWRPPGEEEIEQARQALADIGAAAIERRPTGVLSQGERQRVLVARALVNRPALLVLDEALVGLDPLARDRLLDDLARLAARPDAPTLVQVTHHVEEITDLVTHALLMGDGRVVAAGPVADVMTSAHLALAFSAPAELAFDGGRYRLRFPMRA